MAAGHTSPRPFQVILVNAIPRRAQIGCALLVLVLGAPAPSAQVALQNRYLADPEAAIGLADTTARFWLPTVGENGAFYTNVARNGTRTNEEQQMLTQTQNAYGMVRAFQLTGDTTYLGYARRALDYMYATKWDEAHGGWLDKNEGKEAFTHHYALIGISSMFEVARDTTDWEWLLRAYDANEEHLWDSRQAYLGYYERANEDWSNARNKAFSATMDAITTHALYLSLMTDEPRFEDRLVHLADNAVDHFVASMDRRPFGFDESFNSDWEASGWWDTFAFTGHFTKTAWCLGRIYQIEDDPRYLAAVVRIMDDVLEQRQAYRDKISQWWEFEEAFTSGVTAYYLTGTEDYLTYADGELEYFFDTHWDPDHHEFYFSETDDHKGSYYKTSYHSLEMAYYLYLYGNLYLHDRPATLYYQFVEEDAERQIALYPLAIRDDLLEITAVTRDGEPFSAFDAGTRTLTVPPDEGGLFAVTFEATGHPNAPAPARPSLPFALLPNAPNPFATTTQIRYTLDAPAHATLEIYNVLGERVATVVDRGLPAGEHAASVDARDLASGVYAYRLTVGGEALTRTMVVAR